MIKFTLKLIFSLSTIITLAYFSYQYTVPQTQSQVVPQKNTPITVNSNHQTDVETKKPTNSFWSDIEAKLEKSKKNHTSSTKPKTKTVRRSSDKFIVTKSSKVEKTFKVSSLIPKRIVVNSKSDYQKNTKSNKTYNYSQNTFTNTNSSWYSTNTNPSEQYVNGYTKKNGTYVEGYYRTSKNSTTKDNYSYYGNLNPHTGKVGKKK